MTRNVEGTKEGGQRKQAKAKESSGLLARTRIVTVSKLGKAPAQGWSEESI